MYNLYFFCGIPGSGKTTASTKMAEELGAKLYSYDKFKKEFRNISGSELCRKITDDISEDLRVGNNVIFDSVNVTKRERMHWLNLIKNKDYKKIIIVMTTPLEECIRRNSERESRLPDFIIYHLNSELQTPTFDEGWDEIIYM